MSGNERRTVMLPSGRVVPALKTDLEHDEHTPEHLLRWIERVAAGKWPVHHLDFKRKLCTDSRMKEFWDWLGSVRFDRLDMMRSSLAVSEQIYRSTRLPSKPGDMTPAQREAYFKKVRSHTNALRELLDGTRFDNYYLCEMREGELEKPLHKVLSSWGDDESDDGHVVAYQVTPEGRFEHSYNFPDNALMETLFNVIDWTYWEDGWGGGIWETSEPIAQANSESTPIIYFCCTLHDWFHSKGVDIPFRVLATVANVALDLRVSKQIEEDAARKQVRRFQQRRAKAKQERPPGLLRDAGQN